VAFTILSWNVETFGETKLGAIDNVVTKVIQRANADLIFILEGTTKAQTDVATRIGALLAQTTGQDWFAFGSDPTGKSQPLPPVIPEDSWPKRCDLDAYREDLLRSYDENIVGFELKPPAQRDPNEEAFTREALERAGLIRRDLETYSAFFRYDPALWNDGKGSLVALGSWVALWKARPGDLINWNSQGVDIGYATPGSGFNGRNPYVANVYFADPANPANVLAWFPIACFHAPFGDKMEPRAKANAGLLNLATRTVGGQWVDLSLQDQAAVCGDFNISFDPHENFSGLTNPIPADKSWNAQSYGAFAAAGFKIAISELTSLKAVNQNLEPVTNPREFRSSAYDNVMVHSTGGRVGAGVGTVIDLVADVYQATHGGNYLTGVPGLPNSQRPYDAFAFVRKNVSDHLPVTCALQVAER